MWTPVVESAMVPDLAALVHSCSECKNCPWNMVFGFVEVFIMNLGAIFLAILWSHKNSRTSIFKNN